MKSRLAFITLSMLLLIGAGCTSQSAKKTKGTIGVSVMRLANPFFKVIGDTIKEEAAKEGYDVIVTDGDTDVVKQHNQVKDFIEKKVVAIVLCPCNSKSIGPAIKDANNAGIPVFTADLACTASGVKVVAHIATNNYQGGKLAGQAMIEALGKQGGKVVILHFKQAESCKERVRGFREVIDNYNTKIESGKIHIVAELPSGGKREQGYKAAQDALEADDDLAGIFAINDPSALGARAALEQAGKADRVKIISFDGQPMGKQAVKDGKIYAEPVQFPQKIARLTVKSILQYFDGIQPEREQLIPTQLYRRADGLKDASLK